MIPKAPEYLTSILKIEFVTDLFYLMDLFLDDFRLSFF